MQNEIRSLTGLRGVAAVYVAILHLYRPLENEQIVTFIRHGYLAVDLFFALSGFVMALTYAKMFRSGISGGTYRAFLIKRVARIYPLYLLLTLSLTALVLLKGVTDFYGSNFPLAIAANLLMIQTWGLAVPIVFASWSVSTEWAVYLLFPLIIRNLLYGHKLFAAAGGIICAMALVTISVVDSPIVQGSQPTRIGPLDLYSHDAIGPMVRCIGGFVLGVLAYRVRMIGSMTRIIGSNSVTTILFGTVIGLLCVGNTDIAAVAIFPILIVGLSYEDNIVARTLGSKPVYMLGVWSYSIYLLHPPLVILQHQLAGLLASVSVPGAARISTVAALTIVVTLSYYCHMGIEGPGRKLLQRLLQRHASVEVAPNRG